MKLFITLAAWSHLCIFFGLLIGYHLDKQSMSKPIKNNEIITEFVGVFEGCRVFKIKTKRMPPQLLWKDCN